MRWLAERRFLFTPAKRQGADPPEGYTCLQSEGWPVFYRNVQIKVLPD